ncbi:hypothetical protein F4774DRAFT_425275 [Daldinia eschscholtzii]|nr:hypothetical protein F4774DRAFT_425275 [Daldinia eschscholtzii]
MSRNPQELGSADKYPGVRIRLRLRGPSAPPASTGQPQVPGPVASGPPASGPPASGVSSASLPVVRLPPLTSGPSTSGIPASGPPAPPTHQGFAQPRPGIDYPIFYPRADTGVYDPAFYSAPPPPPPAAPQPTVNPDGTPGPLQRPHHFYGCSCALCASYYHPSNYFLRGTHDPTGRPPAPYAGSAGTPSQSTGVSALDRPGLEALTRQAREYMSQGSAGQSRNPNAPQMQQYPQPPQAAGAQGQTQGQTQAQGQHQAYNSYFPPYNMYHPTYAPAQGATQGPPQGTAQANARVPAPHFPQQAPQATQVPQAPQAPQAPQETEEERERRERDERIRRYREQHERAVGFSESDDEEFIPNIKDP